jgi:hypothetical protein
VREVRRTQVGDRKLRCGEQTADICFRWLGKNPHSPARSLCGTRPRSG